MMPLNKTLRVLEIFIDSQKNELSLSELTALSGFKKTTVNRILTSLKDWDYLNQTEKGGKYSIGLKLIHFTNVIKHKINFRDIAMPYLVKLGALLGELVTLVNWDGKNAYLAEEVESENFIRTMPDPSYLMPLYCTGIGKIFLATMTDHALEEYCKNVKLESRTPNTITDINLLKNHLRIVERENVAYDDEEYIIGSRNIASGIKNVSGDVISGISVVGPSIRITRAKMIEISVDVKRCALEISRIIGYEGE